LNVTRFLLRLLLGRRLPRTQGTIPLSELHGPVTIHRDRWGIPYIEAENDHDASLALGFCHGQDRAFQLELMLRIVRGTLAELVGSAGVAIDRLSRRIGFFRSAEEQLAVLDPEVRSSLEAYSQGTWAGITRGLPRRAHEFVLLRCQPTPWAPCDSLGVMKLMAFALCSNWDVELARLRILMDDGPEALAALDPVYQAHHPLQGHLQARSVSDGSSGSVLDQLNEEISAFFALVQRGGGSNNWVVAPARTATGRPLLANDPHLAGNLPSPWYLAQVRTPTWAAAGATFIGSPAFPAGHNGIAGWGVTAGMVDNTDLFLEEIGPDGQSVRSPEGFVPCALREEIIQVKGGEPITEQVLITPRGPIISPALDGVPEALSLRANWLDPLPVKGLLELHRTRSFPEFRQILSQWPGSPQNLVYADTTGKIGWQLAGLVPRRRSGWGLLPRPGWAPDAGWEAEPVPFADMPYGEDPQWGYLATANAQPLPDGEGPFLGVDWLEGYRLAAIHHALGSKSQWDVADMQELQLNQHSLPWEEMREVILTLPEEDPDTRQALDLLRGWDGNLGADSPAGCVFELFLVEMMVRLARARAPRSYEIALGKALSPLARVGFLGFRRTGHLAHLLHEQPPGWFPHPWGEEMARALASVIARLRARSPEIERWAWGEVRPLELRHVLGQGSLAGIFNRGPFPCGGDTNTINQASVSPVNPLAPPDSIASLRMVLDIGAWQRCRYSLPGGQSGNPLSPHYDDLLSLWQRGEGVPIAWASEEVRQATRVTLRLEPNTNPTGP
jgi:penicillin amidase